jgi:cell pole-organizing protein PopZ
MEDILASIRRILSEDEAPASGSPAPPLSQPAGDDVLVLDPAMMVPDPVHEAEPLVEPPPPPPPPPPSPPVAAPPAETSGLVAPEAAAAAASSMGSLMRTLAAERTMQVRSGGPTIEDIVREELRPLLKEWLDVNLPPMVERLVRAEIERVVGRAVP